VLIHFNQRKCMSSFELQNKEIYFCVTLRIQHARPINAGAVIHSATATLCCCQRPVTNDVDASAWSTRCYQLDTPGVSRRKQHAYLVLYKQNWLQFLFVVKATASKQQVSKFIAHILSTDCVDHDILLHGLEVAFGLTNTALEWIRSFLTDRTQQVS